MRLTPRQRRLVLCLLKRPHSSFELIAIIGSLNVPDVVYRLRKHGLNIDCNKCKVKDRDGVVTRPGIYSLPLEMKNKAMKMLGTAGTAPNKKIQNSYSIVPESKDHNTAGTQQ